MQYYERRIYKLGNVRISNDSGAFAVVSLDFLFVNADVSGCSTILCEAFEHKI
jgi:hypothetical protein